MSKWKGTAKQRAADRRAKKTRYDKLKAERAQMKADLALVTPPTLTEAVAGDFVRLLGAGLPPLEALAYFTEGYAAFSDDRKAEWLASWLSDPLMGAAVEAWNHGAWDRLSEDQRVEVALAHATNQMAHFLYTRPYHEVNGADLGKWTEARKALQARTDAKTGTGQSAYEKFLATLMNQASVAAGPPQLALVKK